METLEQAIQLIKKDRLTLEQLKYLQSFINIRMNHKLQAIEEEATQDYVKGNFNKGILPVSK